MYPEKICIFAKFQNDSANKILSNRLETKKINKDFVKSNFQ